jgi:hypothetical protein
VKGFTLGLAVATCWGISALPAQTAGDAKESRVWALQGLRTSHCVRFLMEPRAAAGKLKGGFRLLRADQDSSLHSALRHNIQAQPEFASWVPSQVCFYFTDAVQIGRRRLVEKNDRYQMLGVWTIAATDQKAGARRDIAVDLYSSRNSLLQAARTSGVRLQDAHSSVEDQADTSSHNYRVDLERTRLVWHGRVSGDSTRVAQPIEEAWLAPGLRGQTWSVRFTLSPTWSRPLVGSLTVEGKGDLAKALKASPIRFVGPAYRQGNAELRFFR